MSSAYEVPSIQPPDVSRQNTQPTSLAPVIQQRLQQFNRRQTIHSVIRGLAWIAAVGVMLLLLAVIVDALVYYPTMRWWLSSSLFAAIIIGLCFCVLPTLKKPHWPTIARSIESLDPQLRNRVLSAVELSDQPVLGDSASFRHQVQRSAAAAIGPVDVAELLPTRLVRKSLAMGLLATALLCLLCFIPGLHLPQRLARILFPWANIGRITAVSIHIESPEVSLPASELIFPRGEMTGIVARIDGPRPTQVILETRNPTDVNIVVPVAMSLLNTQKPNESTAQISNRNRFETVLPLEAETVEFRVVASGAETPWFRLSTMPRPAIDQFIIRIEPPAYSKLPVRQFTSSSADLNALEGSKVRLTLDTTLNAAELGGQLQWIGKTNQTSLSKDSQTTDRPTSQPMQINSSSELYVEFTADVDGEFKFDLLHRASGIKNDFNQTYRLRTVKDLGPKVAWVWPLDDSRIASPQELLDLKLSARDELPIDSAIGRYRVNSQDWVGVELQPDSAHATEQDFPQNESTETAIAWPLDLAEIKLQAGDLLDLEVTALDRHRQPGNSPILRVMISSLESDLSTGSLEQSRQQIKRKLADLADAMKPTADEISKLHDQKDVPPAEALEKLTTIGDQIRQQIAPKIDELRAQIHESLNEPQDRVSRQELKELGKVLEKWKHQSFPSLEELGGDATRKLTSAEFSKADHEKSRQQLVRPLANQIKQKIDELSQVARAFEMVADNDTARRLGARSMQLGEVAKQLQKEVADLEEPSEMMERRREILAREASELQAAMDQAQADAGKHLASQLQHTRQQLDQVQNGLQRPTKEYKQHAASVVQTLAQVRSHLASTMQPSANNSRRQTTQLGGTSGDRLAEAMKQWDRNSVTAVSETLETAQRLKELRKLHTAGDIADSQFAADLGTAQRALQQAIQTSDSDSQQSKAVRQIADALRKLEAAHALEQTNNTLSQLLLHEGQNQFQREMLLEHPRLWDAYAEQLERTVRLMREAQIPNELIGKTEQLQWNQNAGQAAEKIGERIWSNEPMTTAKPQLLQLSSSIQELRNELASTAEQARQSLQQQAPSLAELARQAASTAAELMDETQLLAEKVDANKVPDTQTGLDGLKQLVGPASEPFEALRDALVDTAGSKNLLDQAQLEQARKADAALNVVTKAKEQLEQSLEQVLPSDPSNQQSTERLSTDLQKSASKQSDVAESMRSLANYLGSEPDQDTGAAARDPGVSNDVAKDDLQLLKEMADALRSDSQSSNENSSENPGGAYEQAKRLSQIAGLSSDQMLKSLERQLKSNSAMQSELSEIAADAAEQALRQLDRSEKRQDALTPALEQSDPRVKSQKELMAHDLNTAKSGVEEILQRLLQEAQSASQAGQASSPAIKLQEEVQQLQKSMSSLPHMTSATSFKELQDSTKRLSESLDRVGQQAAEIEKTLSESAAKPIDNQNEQQKNQQSRDAKSRQDRIRNQSIQQAERQQQAQQRAVKSAQNQVKHAAQELKNHQSQLERTQKELQKQPDQAWLKEAAERQQRNVALSEVKLAAERQMQEAMEQRQIAAEEFNNQIKNAALPDLNQPNPQAQLAQSLAQQSAQRAQQLRAQVDSWERELNTTTEAAGQEIASQAVQETNVQSQVRSAAEDLARASRHEARLQQMANSQQLDKLAADTAEVANQQLQQARDQLAQADQSSKGQDRPTGQATTAATSASIEAAQRAGEAIERAAETLRKALNSEQASATPKAGSKPADQLPTPSPSNANSSSPLSAEQMAQILDELDRQVNSPNSSSQSESSSDSQQTTGAKPPTTLAQIAQQLAQQMNLNRQSIAQSSQTAEPRGGTKSSSFASAASGSSQSRANVNPQSSGTVRVLDVTRVNDQWGELRQQQATQTVESQRDQSSSRYRRAIDAYFKAIAESHSNGASDGSNK